jgi:hypothetical protein
LNHKDIARQSDIVGFNIGEPIVIAPDGFGDRFGPKAIFHGKSRADNPRGGDRRLQNEGADGPAEIEEVHRIGHIAG